jgi:hypothetical protein
MFPVLEKVLNPGTGACSMNIFVLGEKTFKLKFLDL